MVKIFKNFSKKKTKQKKMNPLKIKKMVNKKTTIRQNKERYIKFKKIREYRKKIYNTKDKKRLGL